MFSSKMRLSLRPSGTSPRTMRCARPSTIAVLPTPGSPMRTGLFFVRRERTWMTRRISSSRPMTGSILPLRETLDDRGLAHAGLANEDRVVLRAAREDLDDAPDLLVATDDGIDLALARDPRRSRSCPRRARQ